MPTKAATNRSSSSQAGNSVAFKTRSHKIHITRLFRSPPITFLLTSLIQPLLHNSNLSLITLVNLQLHGPTMWIWRKMVMRIGYLRWFVIDNNNVHPNHVGFTSLIDGIWAGFFSKQTSQGLSRDQASQVFPLRRACRAAPRAVAHSGYTLSPPSKLHSFSLNTIRNTIRNTNTKTNTVAHSGYTLSPPSKLHMASYLTSAWIQLEIQIQRQLLRAYAQCTWLALSVKYSCTVQCLTAEYRWECSALLLAFCKHNIPKQNPTLVVSTFYNYTELDSAHIIMHCHVKSILQQSKSKRNRFDMGRSSL